LSNLFEFCVFKTKVFSYQKYWNAYQKFSGPVCYWNSLYGVVLKWVQILELAKWILLTEIDLLNFVIDIQSEGMNRLEGINDPLGTSWWSLGNPPWWPLSLSGPTSDSLSFLNTNKILFSYEIQRKLDFRPLPFGPGPVYRLTHKSSQSVNPMESWSYDGWADKVRTIAYSRKYTKNEFHI
jgi:hypothetical protein